MAQSTPKIAVFVHRLFNEIMAFLFCQQAKISCNKISFMVEVFKTNIEQEELAKQLTLKLSLLFPHYKINFDLHDCDNILRVEGNRVFQQEIIEVINIHGYECRLLE